MSEGTPDISKVISVIMQNPALIEEISSLLGKASEEAPPPEPKSEVVKEVEEAAPTASIPEIQGGTRGADRKRLLGALKPYVSKERAKAIDSMISIAEILDAVRR